MADAAARGGGMRAVLRAKAAQAHADGLHPQTAAQDAPGWVPVRGAASSALAAQLSGVGPLCWKCRGAGDVARARRDAAGKRQEVREGCPVCFGAGRVAPKRKVDEGVCAAGRVSKRSRAVPEGWVVPGPACAGAGEPEAGEELCALLGHWRIFQRVGGHRWSTDDLVTAYVAGQAWAASRAEHALPPGPPRRCLDLGCGIGTVLQMVAWQFPGARCVGVEAQELSAAMARRSIRYNGAEERCRVERGDIRSFQHPDGDEGLFDLVTGTPPYFPVLFDDASGAAVPGIGGMPSCEQSAPARYEFRGGVDAYCAAAAPRLRDASSRFVVCEGFLETNHARVLRSARAAGLVVLKQVCVVGRDDKAPLFAVYVMRRLVQDEQPAEGHPREPPKETLVVRHKGGKRSDAYNRLMAAMGIPPGP